MEFNLFGKAVKIQSSKVNQQTQRAVGWSDEAVSATSGFYNNISAKIATEISKLNCNQATARQNQGSVKNKWSH